MCNVASLDGGHCAAHEAINVHWQQKGQIISRRPFRRNRNLDAIEQT
jgi:hypothetical protein